MSKLGRYELKFLVGAEDKAHLLEALKPGLLPDPNSVDGSYRVTSLYFDSTDLRALWEKLDGVAIRKKIRLRYYGDVPERAFLEIKARHFQQVYKQRLPLSNEVALELLQGERNLRDLPKPGDNPKHWETYQVIQSADSRDMLRGTVLISYRREAWIGRVDPSLRVTFDHYCQAHSPGCHQACPEQLGLPALDPSMMVFEVKFNKAVPRWVRDAVNLCRVRPVRFSKYAEGVMKHRVMVEAGLS